ncbi:hypothetical protein [Streptomyces sp. NPDC059003]|uniref:hypothetical protein n=1 Tax=Streptomyces sp. NPDC059003 TaxID=3346691 RepID=UPI0036AEB7AA
MVAKGIAVPMSDLFGTAGAVFLDELPVPAGYQARLRALREVMGELDRQLARLDKEIAADRADYRAVQTIGGIGPVLAAVFVAEIGASPASPPRNTCARGPGSPRATASRTRWPGAGI